MASDRQTLKLFDYQEAAVAQLRENFKAGVRSQILCLGTGAGKTESAISLLEATARKGKRAAMILDRIVLCDQTSQRLDKYGIEHGVIQSGHWRYRPYERIQICSAATLEKRGSFPGLDLLIVDECHCIRADTAKFIKNNPQVRVIGLTATPFTKGLSAVYETIVSPITTSTLVDNGRLVPLRVFIAKETDMTGAKPVAGEWSKKETSERGIKIVGDVVAEWQRISTEVFGGPQKTIVFAAGVDHAIELSRRFAEIGENFVPLSYKDDGEFKRDIIDDFSKPDTTIRGLIATDILTKGFDVSDCMIGISARPFKKSFSSHVQQLGRVIRSHPGKDFAVWIDHSGNYIRFRELWYDLYSNGVQELQQTELAEKTPPKEKTEEEKEAAKCPKCAALWRGIARTCEMCGYERPLRNSVDELAGKATELAPTSKVDRVEKEDFYRQLLKYARMKGYSDGWAFHKYKEKFNVGPSWKKVPAEEVKPEVAAWIKSRMIAWSKGARARFG